MHVLFDQHMAELNKEEQDNKMVEQMETQIENVQRLYRALWERKDDLELEFWL